MPDNKPDLSRGLRQELKALLAGGRAHARFEDAVEDFPFEQQGIVPKGLPYSAWQLLEHLRIAQRDILDFSKNSDGSYKAKNWPKDYWPDEAVPPDQSAWVNAVQAVLQDRAAFEKLLEGASDQELVSPFDWGEGQSLLHEALLVADHAAYHVGELVLLRRLLGIWRS